MIKKTFILISVVCLLLVAVASPTQAQSNLKILQSSAEADFPKRLTFNLSAESNVDIVDIRLSYTVDRTGFADVTSEAYVEFVPDTKVDVDWTLEMLKIGGLPTGASVRYWWTVKDKNGNKVQTAPATVPFNDNRYRWRSLTEGQVTLHWYEGDDTFAEELMSAAQQAIDRLAEDTGAHLEKPVDIYVYANTTALQGAMIYPAEWTGGVAFPRFGIISIGIAYINLGWGKSAITHEMAHLVVHQMTLNPYSGLPVWLDEGLAVYAEGLLSPQYSSRLYDAVKEDRLLSVRSLCSPFSAYSETATLSYAESYSLVEFLINQYGQAKMLELLNTFQQGSTYDAALEKVYGFDTEGLDALWRAYVTQQYQPAEQETGLQKNSILTKIMSRLPRFPYHGEPALAWRWRS